MKRYSLVIFDLDGTTADTLDGIRAGLNRVLEANHFPTHTRDGVMQFVNYGVRQFVIEALPPEVRTDEALLDRITKEYSAAYADTYHQTVPFDGMIDLLDRLSAHSLIALNSNKQDDFVKILADELFEGEKRLIAAEGFRPDRPGKPDPSMALAIMHTASERLGVELTPADCAYVGDSDVDYHTAVNAGMHPISVSWGYRPYDFLRTLGDQPVARTMDELAELLGL